MLPQITPKKLALLGILSIALSTSANAAVPLCVKGQAVLRDSHEQNHIHDKRFKASGVVGSYSRKSGLVMMTNLTPMSSTEVVACSSQHNPCFKIVREARKGSFQDFLRTKALACDPNFILSASDARSPKGYKPNDLLLKKQWGFKDSTERFNIGTNRLWKNGITGSRDVLVGVIDTGVDLTHPDLSNNVRSDIGLNSVDPSNITGDANDNNGHGTHVAGTIGAEGNNTIGVAGVNWKTSIVPMKFLDEQGSGTLEGAIVAIDYATSLKEKGYNLVATNNSWGGGEFSQALYDAIKRANDRDILFIAAAGNEANDNDASPSYPASYDLPNIITVAALDKTGQLAYFSNYGSKSTHIAAPGVDIASCYKGGKYALLSGTSMAAPHVTGAVALLKSVYPSSNGAQLKDLILKSAVQVKGLSVDVNGGKYLEIGRAVTQKTSSKKVAPLY